MCMLTDFAPSGHSMPVALLDTAASHLSLELIKKCSIVAKV